MRGHSRGVRPHGAELGHFEEAVVFADPVGPVQNRSNWSQFDRQGSDQHRNGEENKRHAWSGNVKKTFHDAHVVINDIFQEVFVEQIELHY